MTIAAALLASTGCRNSSGSLGKATLTILNVLSLEGEGITWDNRVPSPGAATALTEIPERR
jgi:hypothetical protein